MSRNRIILVLIMMCISIGLLVYSFAYVTTTYEGEETNYLTVSNILVGLTDATESITLQNELPTLDKFGVLNDAFSFSISNTDSLDQMYTVRLIDSNISTIPNSDIRYQLTKNGVVQEIKTLPENGVIDSGMIADSGSVTYSLIVWLGYNAVTSSGTWDKVVKVEAGVVNIDESGANPPILLDNMMPVYYDIDGEVWRKADVTNSNADYQWYDYDDRMWANSVVVSAPNRSRYLSDTITPVGEEIPMDDILMFYVWIPRFKYDLFESGSDELINVTFETGVENTGTMKCNIVNGVQTCVGEETSYTHPAFTFGGEELTGYWINKFELSPEASTTCYSSTGTANCNINNLNVTSKPNQKSLKYISLGNLFYTTRNIEISENIYGFSNVGTSLNGDGTIVGDNNDYDIHLSRNFETAALSYLVYSNYGKYSNPAYTNDEKTVFINNSSTKTGSSYVNEMTYDYNIDYYGVGASSTGNIYGVYDLNGAVQEYVMANVLSNSGEFRESVSTSSPANFTTSPLAKYYDGYANASSTKNLKMFYGDATVEFVGFDGNFSVDYTPFFERLSIDMVGVSYGTASSRGGRSVITIKQDIYITEW